MAKKIVVPHYHLFEVGDLVCDQRKILKVITGIKDDYYSFMYTDSEWFDLETTEGRKRIHNGKGSTGHQHVSVFDKYHYSFQPFLK